MRDGFPKGKTGCLTRQRRGFGQVKHSTMSLSLSAILLLVTQEILTLYKREGMNWNLENYIQTYIDATNAKADSGNLVEIEGKKITKIVRSHNKIMGGRPRLCHKPT